MLDIAARLHRGTAGQDRLAVDACDGRLLIAVADGAGGLAGGSRAAEMVIELARAAFRRSSATDWQQVLFDIDGAVHADPNAGETTAVVLEVEDGEVFGACVGDTEAWHEVAGTWAELTEGQRHKPLLGTGLASPIPVAHRQLGSSLVVGTDGLFKYGGRGALASLSTVGDAAAAASSLAAAVRLRSGAWPDDVGIVVARAAPGPALSAVATECFPVSGVGLGVLVHRGMNGLSPGSLLGFSVERPDGTQVDARGTIEYARRSEPGPHERVVVLLHGLGRADCPPGSLVRWLSGSAC